MKKTESQTKYYPLVVHYEQYTEITRERDYEDEWDNDDVAHSVSIFGIETPTKEETYTDITVPFKVVSEKNYYLVYVTYSTGDSFHQESGCVEFIDVFETREKAENLARIIKDHYQFCDNEQRWNDKKTKPPKGYNQFSLEYQNEEGKNLNCHVHWTGYFERLESIDIKEVGYFKPDDGLICYHY